MRLARRPRTEPVQLAWGFSLWPHRARNQSIIRKSSHRRFHVPFLTIRLSRTCQHKETGKSFTAEAIFTARVNHRDRGAVPKKKKEPKKLPLPPLQFVSNLTATTMSATT